MLGLRLGTLLSALALAACGGGSSDDASGTGGNAGNAGSAGSAGAAGSAGSAGSGGGAGAAALWSACELAAGSNDGLAECASVDLPRDYAQPQGPSFPVLVKRLTASLPARGQVWLLHGGPGGSGVEDFQILTRKLYEQHPDLDFYTLDHRGVGGSGRLTCQAEESASSAGGAAITDGEWPSCIASLKAERGEDLPHITTTNSARDVGTLIERFRAHGGDVFVWGGSYGSYLTLRYLHLFPDQPAGVVLEGIAPSDKAFDSYDSDMNEVGAELMQACAQDSECQQRLGPDPWQKTQALLDKIDAGHCPILNLTRGSLRSMLGASIFYGGVRDLVPALIYRIDRCTAADAQAVVWFYQQVFGAGSGAAPGGQGPITYTLFHHIALSDKWGYGGDPSLAMLETQLASLSMSTGLAVQLAKLQDVWPRYPHDEYVGQLPSYSGPLLMLHGSLDPATPHKYAVALQDRYQAPHQYWVTLPQMAHDPASWSPLADGSHCARNIYSAFLDEPKAVDTSCASELLPVLFSGSPSLNTILLGTASAWD
jgi:pimeloyl-ACP methyl ester carboxylesterase